MGVGVKFVGVTVGVIVCVGVISGVRGGPSPPPKPPYCAVLAACSSCSCLSFSFAKYWNCSTNVVTFVFVNSNFGAE